jgi:DNA polymerase III subunit gamma/tau
MSYTVLARKYRPQKFSEVIGQEHVTRTLQNALEQGRTAHGYIFSGHRGIGKTTVARILAAALNCRSSDKPVAEPCGICESCTEIRAGNSVDVIEIDAATNRGIDEIRELREAARYRPARDRFKIYILDEAHQITDAAFNALLKTLEEPPDHIVFMLATTQPEDIPQTIRSRCQHFSFRAVKFDDIVGQLRDLVNREGIHAENDALALLAEAGDGSMRDALSILDQAIACCGGTVTADSVRNLVGAAPAHILEEVMQAVAGGASGDVLQQVDRLIREGHSPTHFARQMVRFLRNAIVAQIAGKESPLLQISNEERERVARVAGLFSEEDLTRHLQIMLRTHSELGYKQEQRFHLELGLLKMAHAQRLLPIEQLLSDVASSSNLSVAAAGGSRIPGRPSIVPSTSGHTPDSRKTESATAARPGFVSPFAADSARKGGPRQDSSGDAMSGASRALAPGTTQPRVVMGATVLADAEEIPTELLDTGTAPRFDSPIRKSGLDEVRSNDSKVDDSIGGEILEDRRAVTADAELIAPIGRLKAAVLQTLADGNQRVLGSLLEAGEWAVLGNELVIRVSESQTVVDMSVGAEGRRLAIASASGVLGKAVKLRIVPGANVVVPDKRNGGSGTSGMNVATGRSRAESDPVVRRLQEKFGAQIRTVIDYKEKR